MYSFILMFLIKIGHGYISRTMNGANSIVLLGFIGPNGVDHNIIDRSRQFCNRNRINFLNRSHYSSITHSEQQLGGHSQQQHYLHIFSSPNLNNVSQPTSLGDLPQYFGSVSRRARFQPNPIATFVRY